MSKTHRDLAKMERAASEVDGEYCVPQEEDEVRYHIDLGPIFGDVQRPGSYFLGRVLLFVPAMFLFILAIQLMKTGAATIGPTIEGSFPFANPASTLGTAGSGPTWPSGSPAAATTISLFARRPHGAETSRCCPATPGASFIVLVTGFPTRSGTRRRSADCRGGIQAMTMTMVQHPPGDAARPLIFRSGALTAGTRRKPDAVLGRLWGPFVDAAETHLPGWAMFVVGTRRSSSCST
jgi:hypothetical protein